MDSQYQNHYILNACQTKEQMSDTHMKNHRPVKNVSENIDQFQETAPQKQPSSSLLWGLEKPYEFFNISL